MHLLPSRQKKLRKTAGVVPCTTQGSMVPSSKSPFWTRLVTIGGPAVLVVASTVVVVASSTVVEISVSSEVVAVVLATTVVKELIASVEVAEGSALVSDSVTLKVSDPELVESSSVVADSAVEVSMVTDDSMPDSASVALREVVVVAAPSAVVVPISLLSDDVVVGRE